MKKIISFLIAIIITLSIPLFVFASESFSYQITTPTEAVCIGSEFTVSVSLADYEQKSIGIRGIQIDVTGIDSSILEVISHSSAIVDGTATSNKTTQGTDSIRLIYATMSGTLNHSTSKILNIKFRVKDNLQSDGEITLPISIKTVATDGNTTQKKEMKISYKVSDTVSVDVTWGSMEFVYDDGTWDTVSHKWIGSGWKPASENANAITVKNNGASDVKASLSYAPASGYESISGTFCDSNKSVVSKPVKIAKGGMASTYYLNLSGVTEERQTDSFIKVGTATLTLTE